MSRTAPTRDAIVDLLAHHPEGLTKDEIAAELGKEPGAVATSLRYDREKHGTKNFRIRTYARMQGRGGRAQAVYVTGPGKDATRPDLSKPKYRLEQQARYREKYRAVINARLRVSRGHTVENNIFRQLMK